MNQKEFKISIVTPSYNQCAFLEETLISILNQNHSNLELIVIDGGSTDNSPEIIKKYASQISFWVSEKDRGQSHAINKGFEKCTGDIIAWLNSDDLYTENTLNRVSEIFQSRPDLDFIHAESQLFDESGVLPSRKFKKDYYKAQLLGGMPSPQPSYFFRRELLTKIGHLNEDLDFGMDYDFFLRISLEGKGEFFDEVWSKYRIHSSSKTETGQMNFAQDWIKVFTGLLKSFKSEQLITRWSNYDLAIDSNLIYDTSKVQLKDLDTALGIALYHQSVFLNQAGESKKSFRLLNYLKKDYPKIFDHFGVDKYFLKLKVKNLFS